MKNKTYPANITNEISLIATELKNLFTTNKANIRTVAKFSGLSVNSVKSVLTGKTANIASYSLIASALGTNLIDLVHGMKANMMKAAQTNTSTV